MGGSKKKALEGDAKVAIYCLGPQWSTYHTVVADNHNFQILHFLKCIARHLQKKRERRSKLSISNTSICRHDHRSWTLRLRCNSATPFAYEATSETHRSLFPALQPGKVCQLREKRLLLNWEHKQREPRIIQNRIFITKCTPLRGSTDFRLEYPQNCSHESSMKHHVYLSGQNGINVMMENTRKTPGKQDVASVTTLITQRSSWNSH